MKYTCRYSAPCCNFSCWSLSICGSKEKEVRLRTPLWWWPLWVWVSKATVGEVCIVWMSNKPSLLATLLSHSGPARLNSWKVRGWVHWWVRVRANGWHLIRLEEKKWRHPGMCFSWCCGKQTTQVWPEIWVWAGSKASWRIDNSALLLCVSGSRRLSCKT